MLGGGTRPARRRFCVGCGRVPLGRGRSEGELRAALKSALATPNPRPEDRRPKETRRPRSELIATPAEQQPVSFGHSRNSDFGLLSDFGLRFSDFRHAEPDLPSTGRTLEQPWGELDRRTVVAGQNVFGTRETEPQILAALDKNVCARWKK